MKKIGITILASVYLCSVIGINIHMHYCMDKSAGWGFVKTESTTCPVCGMEKSEQAGNKCCKDESRFIKNIADQQTTESSIQLTQTVSVELALSFIESPLISIASVTTGNLSNLSPPRNSGVAVYIRNSVFRI